MHNKKKGFLFNESLCNIVEKNANSFIDRFRFTPKNASFFISLWSILGKCTPQRNIEGIWKMIGDEV